jgi:hypothetical protein
MPLIVETLWAAAFVFGSQYVVVPLAVRGNLRVPAEYEFEPIDWNEFIAARSAKYLAAHEELVRCGFQPETATSLDKAVDGLYLHPAETAGASIMSVWGPAGEQVIVEFNQAYAEGPILNVINSKVPSAFPKTSLKRTYRFPNVNDVGALYQRFLAIRAREARQDPVSPPPGRRLQRMADSSNEEMRILISRGYFAAVPLLGRRGPTLKGAFLMTWKQAWPVNSIRLAMERRQAERALTAKQLGALPRST